MLNETALKHAAGLHLADDAVMLDDKQKMLRDSRELVRKFQSRNKLMDEKAPEGDDMGVHVGDITYNFPGETIKQTETTHTTDATAVAAAVERVQKVHNSPVATWARRAMIGALGASLAGNAITIPALMASLLKKPAPAAATATVNVPTPPTQASKPVDTDTDTTTQYELELVPN